MIRDTYYSTKKRKKKSRKQISYLITTFRKKQKEISQVASFPPANASDTNTRLKEKRNPAGGSFA